MQVSSLKNNITVLQMLLNLRKFCTLSLKKIFFYFILFYF